jgi:hypothetical protein
LNDASGNRGSAELAKGLVENNNVRRLYNQHIVGQNRGRELAMRGEENARAVIGYYVSLLDRVSWYDTSICAITVQNAAMIAIVMMQSAPNPPPVQSRMQVMLLI